MRVFGVEDFEKPIIKSTVIEIDGESGLIYYRSVSSRVLQSLSEGELAKSDGMTKLATRISEMVVNEDGTNLMTVDQVLGIPLERQRYIFDKISEDIQRRAGGGEDKPGEDSGEVNSPSSELSTN